MTRSAQKRRAAYRRGTKGEGRAAALLRLKGYRILERRWKSPVGEVDLIAKKRHTLVFIEVKARASLKDAAESIVERQRQRIARAAEAYLAYHPDLEFENVRFDAILVVPGRWPQHIEAAWLSAE